MAHATGQQLTSNAGFIGVLWFYSLNMGDPNSMEELKRLLQEARQNADKERQRAEREQQRAEASEQQTQPTTLDEYITGCHSLVFSSFNIERNQKLTSKGPITNPRNKWCPTNLRPWPDFLHQQRITFGTLYDTFPADRRVFENRSFLSGLGNRLAKRKIADEKVLENFLHISVEDPVKAIVDQLPLVAVVGIGIGLWPWLHTSAAKGMMCKALEEILVEMSVLS